MEERDEIVQTLRAGGVLRYIDGQYELDDLDRSISFPSGDVVRDMEDEGILGAIKITDEETEFFLLEEDV